MPQILKNGGFHGILTYRLRGTLIFMGLCLGAGSFFESVSLRTGFPFGHYYFTDVMGPKLLKVPVLLVLAYLGRGRLKAPLEASGDCGRTTTRPERRLLQSHGHPVVFDKIAKRANGLWSCLAATACQFLCGVRAILKLTPSNRLTMNHRPTSRRRRTTRSVLRLLDLEHAKAAVLNNLTSQRGRSNSTQHLCILCCRQFVLTHFCSQRLENVARMLRLTQQVPEGREAEPGSWVGVDCGTGTA